MTEPRTETILGKERLKYLDITKGIAILLMVWGHRVVTYSADDVRLIFSFHMPLFFIISGYFLNRETPTELFIKKKARQLLSPYYLTAIIIILASAILPPLRGYKSGEELSFAIAGVLWGSAGACYIEIGDFSLFVHRGVAIWFLWGLFWALLIVKLAIHRRYLWLLVPLIAFLGVFSYHHIAKLPLAIQPGMNASFFVLLGYAFRKYHVFEHPLFHHSLLQIGLLALWFFVACFSPLSSVGCCLHSMSPSFLVSSVTMSCFLIYVSQRIERAPLLAPFLARCGRYSLWILCAHSVTLFLATKNHFLPFQALLVAAVVLCSFLTEGRLGKKLPARTVSDER